MRYVNEFIKRVVDAVVARRCSAREAERLLGVPRKTIGRWLQRRLGCLPTWFSRAAKRVRNRTPEGVLSRMRVMLDDGLSVVRAWAALGKRVCMRTIQRWKAAWFPVVKEKRTVKRYERRKALSLMHTDWGIQRIKDGSRCCFTFYEDDATRRVYACHAYSTAGLPNTLDSLQRALQRTPFASVLTDCGKVYSRQWNDACRHAGVKPVHTRPYNPGCNGKAEAVVKKIKRFLKRYDVRNLTHAKQLLRKFEREYNNTPHASLKYRTPLEVYKAKQTTGAISAVT